MFLFLFLFFSIYGGMHLYLFIKLRTYLSLSTDLSIIAGTFMVFMTFSPLLIRLSERSGMEGIAVVFSWTGYIWMAMIFLFFSFSLAMDIAGLLLKGCISLFGGKLTVTSPLSTIAKNYGYASFLASVGMAIVLTVYGYFEALNIRVERIEIRTDKVKRDVRIVQISDLHTGLIVRGERLKRILDKVRLSNPHIIVSTGDLVDGQIDSLEGLSEYFREINPPHGMFAVTGNHEFYAGLSEALRFTEMAGFTVLRGEAVYIPDLNISIAGVDDPAGRRYGLTKGLEEESLLRGLKPDSFRILLKHRPIINEGSRGLFDLQLSGHTHKGQIFPFSILTALYYPKDSGCLNDLPKKMQDSSCGEVTVGREQCCYLYVSRGSGTWGPPVRVFAPPEVTVIDIIKMPSKN